MNMQRILILDNKSELGGRLKQWLSEDGFGLVLADAQGTQLNSNFIQEKQIALIIHICDATNTFEKPLAELVESRFPIPIIHLSDEKQFDAKNWLITPFHERMSLGHSKFEFARKIQNMIFFAKTDRELHDMRFRQAQIEKFSATLRRKRLPEIVEAGFVFFKEEFQTEQLMWFPHNTLREEMKNFSQQRRRSQKNKVKQPEGMPTWQSNFEIQRSELQAMFAKWPVLELELKLNKVQTVGPEVVMFPLNLYGVSLGHFVFLNPKAWREPAEDSLCSDYLGMLSYHLDQALALDQVEHMTYKDDLTDLYNQRYLPVILEQELQRASRHHHQFSVLFLDIDFFKMVNDTKGHLVGSKVLIELSKLLKESIRGTDFAFRYGGDEYVIVLSDADSKEATLVAERLRKRTENKVFSVGENEVRVTVSIGIATYPQHAKTTAELLKMADDAMYKGKNKSRNIVYLAS